MSKTIEATAPLLLPIRAKRTCMQMWHQSVGKIDMHVYFNFERLILKSISVIVDLIELLN